MLQPRSYPELMGKALMLEADPFIVMVDDDNPWVEGLFMVVVVGIAVGAAHLVGSLLATGFPYDVHKDPENVTYFQRALAKGLTVRRPGAAALDLANVAAGRLDGFWEVKLNPWDVAAGWLIITEAGGRVTGIEGEDYRLGNRYVVASNGLIHPQLLDMIHGK